MATCLQSMSSWPQVERWRGRQHLRPAPATLGQHAEAVRPSVPAVLHLACWLGGSTADMWRRPPAYAPANVFVVCSLLVNHPNCTLEQCKPYRLPISCLPPSPTLVYPNPCALAIRLPFVAQFIFAIVTTANNLRLSPMPLNCLPAPCLRAPAVRVCAAFPGPRLAACSLFVPSFASASRQLL